MSLAACITRVLTAKLAYGDIWFVQNVTESQTILLPNNTILNDAFAQLARNYNITKPDTFLERVIQIADINFSPPRKFYDTSDIVSNQLEAALLLIAFEARMVLTGRNDFYSNATVRPCAATHWPFCRLLL